MSAKLLEGGPIADAIKAEVKETIAQMPQEQRPQLVAVMVGDNPGARAYAKMQRKSCDEVGIVYELKEFDESISEADLIAAVDELNEDGAVDGIILQMPVPEHINARTVQAAIASVKDVDGVNPANLGAVVMGQVEGAPCTAQAVVRLVQETGIDLYGTEVVVVGHSEIVGKPVALLLLDKFATTTVCHIGTSDAGLLEQHTTGADILIVAVGVPGLIKGSMIKSGATVIDVGINRVKDEEGKRKIVGDVEFDSAVEVAGTITPVPGGVGPVTTAMLLKSTLYACQSHR